MSRTVVVGSYAQAKKYLEVGWKISSIKHVHLPCTKEPYHEHTLIWDKDCEPIIPLQHENQ